MERRYLAAILLVLAARSARAQPGQEVAARPPHHRWIRLALGTTAIAVTGEAWYFRNGKSTNADDSAFSSVASDLHAKVTGDGFRFDGDGFDTNALKHPLFGLSTYALARESGFGPGGAFAFASLTSLAWETFGEFHEYGAYNDLLLTSTSGVPLGEAFHLMLHEKKQRTISIETGLGQHFEHGTSTAFGTVALRGEAHAARRRQAGWKLYLPFDDHGRRGLDIFARTDFAVRVGQGSTLYLATTFDYRRFIERRDQDWDLHAVAKLGPAIVTNANVGAANLSARLDTTCETGEETAHAFPKWREAHPEAIVRSTEQLNPHGYYHAVGVGALLRLSAAYGPVTAEARAGIAAYRALSGTDQFQEMLTADPALSDIEQSLGTSLRVDLGRLSGGIEISARRFAGRADDFQSLSRQQEAIAVLAASW